MALLIECPNCRLRQPLKNLRCGGKGKGCGLQFKKGDDRVYWIEYYVNGIRKRERIGTSRKLAELTLGKRKVAIAEGRKLDILKEKRITFKELTQDYLEYARKNKRSYERDEISVKHLLNFFGNVCVKDITPRKIELYMETRLNQVKGTGTTLKPATVNREIACLKHLFNRAIRDEKIEFNAAAKVRLRPENNVRDRVISHDEFQRLFNCSPEYMKPVLLTAYYTGMRRGEILNLKWDRVDLKMGFIRLRSEDTKTNEGRSIPLHPVLIQLLKDTKLRYLKHDLVFTRNGEYISPLGSFKEDFRKACKKAEIDNFHFHDLRHVCINNWRQAGHDYFKIMKATGHKTITVFKRYNTVDDEELKILTTGPRIDTYMDTLSEGQERLSANHLK